MGQLFSKKNKEVLFTPLGLNNPVTVQVLGICSALAVTAQLEPAIVMGLSVRQASLPLPWVPSSCCGAALPAGRPC